MRLARFASVLALGFAAGCSTEDLPTSAETSGRTGTPPLASITAGGTVTVLPTSTANVFTSGWFGYGDRPLAAGLASIGIAPGTQVLGNGNLQLSNSAFGWEVAAYGSPAVPAATPLSQITELAYATYTASGQAGITQQHVALQFTIDYDLNDLSQNFQGRLVYEPYHCNAVQTDTWQTWNTLDETTTGCWWQTSSSPRVANAVVAVACPQGNPCTWAEVQAAYPNAGFHPTNGATGLIFKVGSGWVGTFHTDALVVGISGTSTSYDFEAYAMWGSCAIDISGSTYTLLADCTTDVTLSIPNGFTLDGNGYTITAIDPAGGHFLGAVVRNGGSSATVENVTITASALANICDAGDDRLRGILFEGASGIIRNNTVVNVNQGPSGCQEGNAIETRNAPFDATGSDLLVTISDNTVSGYIKNGITANGSVAATITNNVVTGSGPVGVPLAAQNGIQVAFGATAIVKGNTITGNNYTPKSYVACGLLLFQADGVKASANSFSGNERDLCNFGKGGGTFNPQP